MDRVIEALRQEHQSMGCVLDFLESEIAYVVEFVGRRRADYRLAWAAVDYLTEFPDLIHHPKEEMLFERLGQLDPAAARSIGDLPATHAAIAADLGALGCEMKAVMEDGRRSRNELVGAARAYIKRKRRHIEMEEGLFFSLAERMLDVGSWAFLEHRLTARFEPLIGGEPSERFEALRRTITASATVQRPSVRGGHGLVL